MSNSTHYVAAMALPVTGELFKLEDLPTSHYAPTVEPAFAVFTSKKAAVDPNAPLDSNFDL